MQIDRLENLVPKPGERAVIIGQTGSGKSFLSRALIMPYLGRRQIIVLDTKHDPIWTKLQARYTRSYKQLQSFTFPKTPLIVYRPEGLEANPEKYDELCSWVYERGNTCLLIDETSHVVNSPTAAQPGFTDLVTRGRVRELTVLFGTQRPSYIPRIVFSESNKFFVMHLSDRRDRDTVAGYTSAKLSIDVPDRHGFWFYDVSQREPVYYKRLRMLHNGK